VATAAAGAESANPLYHYVGFIVGIHVHVFENKLLITQ
jgi:hypothetical protein